MWNVKIGDLVVYVSEMPQYRVEGGLMPHPLEKGTIYTVAHIELWSGIVFIHLAERPMTSSWPIFQFRLITKPSIESLRQLLLPAPDLANSNPTEVEL